jgi:Kef-type K+ transport system membrane component KefB
MLLIYRNTTPNIFLPIPKFGTINSTRNRRTQVVVVVVIIIIIIIIIIITIIIIIINNLNTASSNMWKLFTEYNNTCLWAYVSHFLTQVIQRVAKCQIPPSRIPRR